MAKRKNTGELAMFRSIWSERKHACEVCNKRLSEFGVNLMAHILGKGAYPRFRLRKDNIVILCPEHHYMYDFQTDRAKLDSRFNWVFEEAELLKIEYNQDKGYTTFK